jgi:NaMN:DMB phosphoribosyltransferase
MFVKPIQDHERTMSRLLERVAGAESVDFCVCVGSTKTSDVEGVSAAGATPEDRRMTPGYDAEALLLGRTSRGASLPVSPEGIVSPVVLTRASLGLIKARKSVVDCGAHYSPDIDKHVAGNRVAECLSSGEAMPLEHVKKLYEFGVELGHKLAERSDLLVISECVPAGTTTAKALLTGLGYETMCCLSSSMQVIDHHARWQLVDRGLIGSGLKELIVSGDPAKTLENIKDPLRVVAAVGDPMQPVVAGMASAASASIPVILAGGSQMLAVYALIKAVSLAPGSSSGLALSSAPSSSSRTAQSSAPASDSIGPAGGAISASNGKQTEINNIGVITTKWVAFDTNARVPELAEAIQAPFACSMPDFSKSRHAGLQAFEQGHVKEGIGAGASMALAHLIGGCNEEKILATIDATYDQMVLGKMPV